MIYREFGHTGCEISSLGFGCMRLPEIEKDGKWFVDQDKTDEMLRYAAQNGVNYFDTAFYYCHANSEIAVGKALKPIRSDVMVSTKLPMDDVKCTDDYRRILETSLKKLDMDYIDCYHFWSINKAVFDQKILGYNLLEEALKAKEEGLIKHISFSFHDDPQNIKYIIDTAQIMETMLVQYNLLDRSNEEMIAYAHDKGLGVLAMGPVGGGRLAVPTDLASRLTAGKHALTTYELAFKFVLGNPNISCALSGMETLDMVTKNLAVAGNDAPMSVAEWEQIRDSMEDLKKFSELYCTGCGYCQPCPKKINIPQIFNAYTHYNVYGLTDTAKKEWNEYCNPEHPGATSKDCVNCGFCEKKCPQKLKIRELLKKVESTLNSL